jgi:hypothetical protein
MANKILQHTTSASGGDTVVLPKTVAENVSVTLADSSTMPLDELLGIFEENIEELSESQADWLGAGVSEVLHRPRTVYGVYVDTITTAARPILEDAEYTISLQKMVGSGTAQFTPVIGFTPKKATKVYISAKVIYSGGGHPRKLSTWRRTQPSMCTT